MERERGQKSLIKGRGSCTGAERVAGIGSRRDRPLGFLVSHEPQRLIIPQYACPYVHEGNMSKATTA